MKKISILFALCLAIVAYAQGNPLIGVWKSDASGVVELSASGDFSYTYEKVGEPSVSGSGSAVAVGTEFQLKITESVGEYTIKINPTGVFRLKKNGGDAFRNLSQWGDIDWAEDLSGMFRECSQLKITATDTPDFSKVTDMSRMFLNCAQLENVPNINEWAVGEVTDMESMFEGAKQFNGDISQWKVGKVETMVSMFKGAEAFNQDLSQWDTEALTETVSMFRGAKAFNKDISGWKVQNILLMSGMFYDATNFSQDLGAWKIKTGATLAGIFRNSGMDCESYSKTLKGWAENSEVGTSVNLSTNSKYGDAAKPYRDELIKKKGWTISSDKYDDKCTVDLGIADTPTRPALKVLKPVKDELIISSPEEIKNIEIYTASGALIKTLKGKQRAVSNLPKGLYILKINTENHQYTEKIIKE